MLREITIRDLDVMPAVPEKAHDEWGNARRYATAAEGFSQASVVAQIMCGFELIELQKSLGTNQGKRTDLQRAAGTSPSNLEKLNWPKLVKAKIGKSDETARTWMNMARAVKPRLKKLDGPWEAPALLALPVSEWPEEARMAVAKTLQGICEGQTQADFLAELGLAKKPKRKGGKTYDRADGKGGRQTLSPEEAEELLRAVCRNTAEHLATLHKEQAYTSLVVEAELDRLWDHLETALCAVSAWRALSKEQRTQALGERLAKAAKPAKGTAADGPAKNAKQAKPRAGK